MFKTKRERVTGTNKIAVDAVELREMLGCGRAAAERFGQEAGAAFKVGRRKLFRVDRIMAYLDELTETNQTDKA